MKNGSWDESAVYRARVRGCLLGGALGDALGSTVTGLPLREIRTEHGETGLTALVPDRPGGTAQVTDDTQLTLFTAEGLVRAHARASTKGIGGAETAVLRHAYLRWLDTQTHPAPPVPGEGYDLVRSGWLRHQRWLYARRDPGGACLSGLRAEHVPSPHAPLDGEPTPVNPTSKGCAAVTRAAPFGLTGLDADTCFGYAARCAQITHGHPTGHYAAGALAALTAYLAEGDSLDASVLRTLELLRRHPGHQETYAALRRAVDLAAEGDPTPEKVESLGAGWVAEEALAIGVYSALVRTAPQLVRYGEDGRVSFEPSPPRTPVQAALLLSVNHSGNSDSTGAICGALLGTHHGDLHLPPAWLARVEGRATIAELADDFCFEFRRTVEPFLHDGSVFEPERYPHT